MNVRSFFWWIDIEERMRIMPQQKSDVLDIYDKDGNKVRLKPLLPECTVEVFNGGRFYQFLQWLFERQNRQE